MSGKAKGMSLMDLIRHQRSELPLCVTADSCAGGTYIVTGSNIGLGYETARRLVSLRPRRVVMAVRSVDRGRDALAAIERDTGVRGVGEVWHLDMSSRESVAAFARRARSDLGGGGGGGAVRVDGLVANAAAAEARWVECFGGWESTVGVNVVATVYLVVLLMPLLRDSAATFGIEPVVDVVTSDLGFTRQADLDRIDRENVLRDVNDSTKWTISGVNRYSLSKLLQIFAIRELASLAPVEQTGVVINYVSPGLCKTGLVRYADFSTRIQVEILRALLGRSAEWGSRSILHSIAAGRESHGKYLAYCKITEDWVPDWASNEQGRQWSKQIWKEVAIELERLDPGCVDRALGV